MKRIKPLRFLFVSRGLLVACACALVTSFASAVEVSTFQGIVDALASAQSGDEIVVAPGEYRSTATLNVPAGVTLRSRDGRATTIILQQADVASQAFRSVSLAAATSVIDGFTFRDIAYTSAANGGCVINLPSGGTVRNCDITGCVNYSGYGVIQLSSGNSTVSNCRLVDNGSVSGGATGIYAAGGTYTIASTLFVGGRPAAPVTGNSNGPAIWFNGGSGTVSHCTICDNFSTTGGYGLGNNNRTVTVKDSIVLSSCLEPTARADNAVSDSNKKTVFKNCLGLNLDNWNASCSGNINDWDPKFVNPLLGDYHLQAGSPCIGAATDGGDVGCFAYDAGYASSVPVVNVAAGADLAAAFAAAPDGAEVRLAAGEYTVPAQITIDRPLRIVGAGRGQTIVRSDGAPHRMFRLFHFRCSLESMTIADAFGTNVVGAAVNLDSAGGLLRDCRVTGCRTTYTGTINTGTIAISSGSTVIDCQIDGNYTEHIDKGAVKENGFGAAGICLNKGTTGYDKIAARVQRCLIVRNHGTAIFGNNSAAMTPTTVFRYCTVTDNDFGYGVNGSRPFNVIDSIVEGGYEIPLKDATLFTVPAGASVQRTLYNAISGGTTSACAVARSPKFVDPVAGDYRLLADSPARGIAAGGGDAGCFQYDPDYVPVDRTVNVAAGGDLTAAINGAADGATLKLAAGVHYVTAAVRIERPLRIVGAGRDVTFVEPANELAACTLFTLRSGLAEIRDLTVRKVNGRAFLINKGGMLENCRVTDSVIDSDYDGDGVGVYCSYGHVYRCQFDGISYDANRNQAILKVSSCVDSQALNYGYVDDSLVTNCKGRNGNTKKGYAVYMTRDGIDVGGTIRNCTIVGNDMYQSLSVNERSRLIQNCVVDGVLSIGLTDANKLTRMFNNCLPSDIGTACVVASDLKLKANGRPLPSSPVRNGARPLGWSSEELDLAGNPRLRKDGSQDIGCYQWQPIGMMVIFR